MSGRCAVCDKSANTKCSKCFIVYYCCKEHQIQDWTMHKRFCSVVEIQANEMVGRHLITTKTLQAGDIVFKEKPLVMGPSMTKPSPICLACYTILTKENSCPCTKCGWPMCNEICASSPYHVAECEMTAATGRRVNIQNFQQTYPIYLCIMLARCLYLKISNPRAWNIFWELESLPEEERLNDRYMPIIRFTRMFFELTNDMFTDEEMEKVCRIIQVNAYMKASKDNQTIIIVFNYASLLENNCLSNCCKISLEHSDYSDHSILITAATEIKTGENVSICYTNPLLGTVRRRQELESSKFFNCQCARCNDVTEMGTMYNALKCQMLKCTGFLLPASFISEVGDWSCNKCTKVMTSKSAKKINDRIEAEFEIVNKSSNVEVMKRFMRENSKILPKTHEFMVRVKFNFTQSFNTLNIIGIPGISEENLTMMSKLCRELTDIFEKISPGEHLIRGLALYSLHASNLETMRKYANNRKINPNIARDFLMYSKIVLSKVQMLYQYEASESIYGEIVSGIELYLAETEKSLRDVFTP